MYIKVINNKPEPYTLVQLRRDNPRTSFPKSIPADLLAQYDIYQVVQTPQPSYNELTESIKLCDPELIDGQWVQQWEINNLSIQQQRENLRVARSHAYRIEADPIFFLVQRGEAEVSEWEAAIQSIKNRFPYPEEES